VSFTAVDTAFAATLLGVDARSLSAANPNAAGVSMPAVDGQEALTPRNMGVLKLPLNGELSTDVPLYRFSSRGRRTFDTWPCYSYELIGCQFNPTRFVYKADTFKSPVLSSMKEVVTHGRTQLKPQLIRVQEPTDPFDLMFDVRVWAKNTRHAMVLLNTLLRQLEARGCIVGYLANGVRKSWELRLSTMNNVDDPEPTLENTQVRGFSWVLTYVVETHLDSSEATSLVRTINEPAYLSMEQADAIQVSQQPVVSVAVSPATVAFAKDQPAPFQAIATFADGHTEDVTELAEWSCSDPSLLRPQRAGLYIGGKSESETNIVSVTARFRSISGMAYARGIITS